LEARRDGGFVSFADFCGRVDSRKVNKRVLESLIKVGAMGAFGNRAALLTMMDEMRVRARPQATKGQQDLFSVGQDEKKAVRGEAVQKVVSSVEEFGEDELTALERQLLGFSLSAKPLIEQIEALIAHRSHRVADAFDKGMVVGEAVKLACLVNEVRVVITRKSGAEMAFVKAEDETGGVDLVIFPRLYGTTRGMWIEGNVLLVAGRIDRRDETQSVLVEAVETEEMIKEKEGSLRISIPEEVKREQLLALKEILMAYPGGKDVYVIFEGRKGGELKLPYKVDWNEVLSQKIAAILGKV
jgi:DNA polymerase-3 subunit alpha